MIPRIKEKPTPLGLIKKTHGLILSCFRVRAIRGCFNALRHPLQPNPTRGQNRPWGFICWGLDIASKQRLVSRRCCKRIIKDLSRGIRAAHHITSVRVPITMRLCKPHCNPSIFYQLCARYLLQAISIQHHTVRFPRIALCSHNGRAARTAQTPFSKIHRRSRGRNRAEKWEGLGPQSAASARNQTRNESTARAKGMPCGTRIQLSCCCCCYSRVCVHDRLRDNPFQSLVQRHPVISRIAEDRRFGAERRRHHLHRSYELHT